jgi:hypothetical protein
VSPARLQARFQRRQLGRERSGFGARQRELSLQRRRRAADRHARAAAACCCVRRAAGGGVERLARRAAPHGGGTRARSATQAYKGQKGDVCHKSSARGGGEGSGGRACVRARQHLRWRAWCRRAGAAWLARVAGGRAHAARERAAAQCSARALARALGAKTAPWVTRAANNSGAVARAHAARAAARRLAQRARTSTRAPAACARLAPPRRRAAREAAASCDQSNGTSFLGRAAARGRKFTG